MSALFVAPLTVCTNRDKYNAALARYPLAAKTFDDLLTEPVTPPIVSEGTFEIPDTKFDSKEVIPRQEAVNAYANEVYELSPIFYHALAIREQIASEFILLSNYDLHVDDFYQSIRTPYRNAKKAFEPGEIERLNQETKEKARSNPPSQSKRILGYNADVRDPRLKSKVTTDRELTSNFYGSAIPTFKLLDKRFSLLLLISTGLGLNSFSDEERIGALNIVAQLLIDTHGEIQRLIAIDDLKEQMKTLSQIRRVLKILKDDPNERVSRNSKILDDFTSDLIDNCLRYLTKYKELQKTSGLN